MWWFLPLVPTFCLRLQPDAVCLDVMFSHGYCCRRYMPKFMGHLHYRIVDVSSLKELCRRWYPREFTQAPKKGLAHRALDDIKESLAELQYYRSAMFK